MLDENKRPSDWEMVRPGIPPSPAPGMHPIYRTGGGTNVLRSAGLMVNDQALPSDPASCAVTPCPSSRYRSPFRCYRRSKSCARRYRAGLGWRPPIAAAPRRVPRLVPLPNQAARYLHGPRSAESHHRCEGSNEAWTSIRKQSGGVGRWFSVADRSNGHIRLPARRSWFLRTL